MKILTFRGPVLTLTILGLASACTPHDEVKEPPTPPEATVEAVEGPAEPEPEPEPEKETVTVAVASVQLQDDCPTLTAAPGPAPRGESQAQIDQERPASPGDVAHGDMPADLGNRRAARCVQSEVQLSIISEDSKALPFAIRAVRLRKNEEGGSISRMQARAPRIWGGSTYAAWDQSIAPGSTLNVRYSLGAPDWGAVEKLLQESSWGPLYVVELEVEVAGRLQTITSPLTSREAEEELVT